ncbi:MAG: NAD(P)-dependent oxidoreductase [Candidatus Woesearchaeota archaeon]
MKIGVIGLGAMGKTLAMRLIDRGFSLVVWNRTISKTQGLKAEVAKSPMELGKKCDIIIINVFDSKAVEDVLLAHDGVCNSLCRGKIVIDTTTNHFAEVLKFHEEVRKRGASYLESPVLGSVIPASQGILTILVSGEKEAFEEAKHILENLGNNIFYLEEPGLATKMKLVNNLCLGVFMATIAEAVSIGEACGIQKQRVIEILTRGAGNSMVLSAKKDKILKNDFSPHFSVAAITKDLRYLQDMASSVKKRSIMAQAAEKIYSKAPSEEDLSAVYKAV